MSELLDAVVVGSGPNGLAAAVALARAGRSVTVLEADETFGGGARSGELTVPGVVHDLCSGVHPFGVASPFFASLPLEEHGLVWRWPEVDLAHPFDDGTAARTSTGFKAGEEAVRQAHLVEAKEVISMGRARTTLDVGLKPKPVTAYHEGGHAIVSQHTRGAKPVYKV